jgi:rhodanese-related sulfurtransferase
MPLPKVFKASGLEAVTRRELAARLDVGDVVVLDVRPGPEFRAGHVPGARSRLVPPGALRDIDLWTG